jgi:hypothetical protein
MLFALVKQLRRRHGLPALGASFRRFRLRAFVAVFGPGLLAGLSDDDPAGITTYSIVGARYGSEVLWVLLLSVGALVAFHELDARLGLVTGKGLVALVRASHGRSAALLVTARRLCSRVDPFSLRCWIIQRLMVDDGLEHESAERAFEHALDGARTTSRRHAAQRPRRRNHLPGSAIGRHATSSLP